jgi:hypothetical protein
VIRKPLEKHELGRLRRRWEYNVKIDRMEMGM